MEKTRTWKKILFLTSMFLGLLFVWNTDVSAENRGTVMMKVGQDKQFESQGSYLPSTKEYYWWVSNPGIISLGPDEGNIKNSKYSRVTALAPGTATLHVRYAVVVINVPVWGGATVEERVDTWTITVEKTDEGKTTSPKPPKVTGIPKPPKATGIPQLPKTTGIPQPPKATGIKLNKKSLTVKQGKAKKLTATLIPAGATGEITWESSNTKIASVKNGTVKGLKKGTVTITARLSSEIYAECKVTVPAKPTSVRLSAKKLVLTTGQKYKLSYTLFPKGAKSKIAWSSSRKAVASVNKSGNITAKKAGTSTVTIKTANGKKASCKVTVKAAKKASINEGKTIKLIVKKPSATVKWSSSNTKVAKIISTSGKKKSKVTIKGIKKGTATITAKVGKKKNKIKITVKHVHKYGPATCTQPQTCVYCGDEKGVCLGHNKVNETCVSEGYCARCGAVLSAVSSHIYDAKGYCTACGKADLTNFVDLKFPQAGAVGEVHRIQIWFEKKEEDAYLMFGDLGSNKDVVGLLDIPGVGKLNTFLIDANDRFLDGLDAKQGTKGTGNILFLLQTGAVIPRDATMQFDLTYKNTVFEGKYQVTVGAKGFTYVPYYERKR